MSDKSRRRGKCLLHFAVSSEDFLFLFSLFRSGAVSPVRVTRKESQPRLSLFHLRRQRGKKRAGENQEGSSLFLSLRDERSSQGYLFLSGSFFTREFGKTEVMSPGKLSNVKKGRITAAARHHRTKVHRRNLLDGWVKKSGDGQTC